MSMLSIFKFPQARQVLAHSYTVRASAFPFLLGHVSADFSSNLGSIKRSSIHFYRQGLHHDGSSLSSPFPSLMPDRRSSSMRQKSDWVVPAKVTIPEDKLDFNFQRSSGAGGQNVNKVNTKAEIRFHVMSAAWLPMEVRERLAEQQQSKINKEGYLALTSQEHRTQLSNRRDVISKMEELVLQAYPRPKVRKQRVGISKQSRRNNIENKRRRSDTKRDRSQVDW